MKWRRDWSSVESAPSREAVLRDQGLPSLGLAPRIAALVDEALDSYVAMTEPRGLLRVIDASSFLEIYGGEGRNLARTPLPGIVAKADHLALFACTVGPRVTAAIEDLFARNEPARAYMLDAVASLAADGLAFAAGLDLIGRLDAAGTRRANARALPYSPGYCGWHVTAQRALFAALEPEAIGVTLNASCLMTPLKSVSGVLAVAPPEAHEFLPDFECCDNCATRQCEDRMALIRHAGASFGDRARLP